MLYLKPPFEVVEGVSVFGDHENPRQHYLLPLAPRFATRPDSSGREVPAVQVIRYAGDAGTGGFLNFDCDLRIEPERLEAISDHIRRTRALKEPPLLAPPPMVDGSVRLMLFGHESPSRPAKPGQVVAPGATPDAPRFVRRLNYTAAPSLMGDEQAAFSVELDQEGVEILDAALRGELSPIGVVYSLTYAALRPAFSVTVNADWNRVQSHLAEQIGSNSLVASAQIDTVVDKLIEDRVIDIQVDSFVAPGDGEEALLGKAEAVNELKDMVLNTFFEPSLQPVEDKGAFVDTGKRVTQLLATGGIGTLFSYRKTDITRIDQKALNATFNERSAVLRTIYPQGHLGGLVQALEQGLGSSHFVSVRLGSAFFKTREVRVVSRADWAGDGIASVNVALRYGDETKNVLLDPARQEGTVAWPSMLLPDGRMRREVQVSYSVAFAAPAGSGRPASLATPAPITTEGDVFEVAPRDLYELMSVPVNVVSFPWERYPSVELDARYRDPATGREQSLHRVLNQEQEGQEPWQVFVADRAHRDISYSLVFHGADDREATLPEVTTTEGLIRVADPFPKRLALTIVAPTAMFETVERAFVDVSYDDGATVQKTASYEFASGLPSTQTFSVELVEAARRDIAFSAMLVFLDGHVVQIPRSVTTDSRLMLRPDMKGRRGIVLRPEQVDFAKRGIREVVVETEFEDAVAQPPLRFAERFTFQAPADVARFEFDYVDGGRSAYRYRVTHKYANGLSKPSAWRDSQAAELVIPVR